MTSDKIRSFLSKETLTKLFFIQEILFIVEFTKFLYLKIIHKILKDTSSANTKHITIGSIVSFI